MAGGRLMVFDLIFFVFIRPRDALKSLSLVREEMNGVNTPWHFKTT
jgi:hypothetical protein